MSDPKGPIVDPMMLDSSGRCCGRKPIVYKRPPHRFCPKCDRSYHLDRNEQISNWAYQPLGDKFWKTYP